VLEAMGAVPRHVFVPTGFAASAYADTPLPIGMRQTISQPYIVAYMTQALQVEEGDRVLEIGTGSGYQAAVLSHLAAEVYSIEILPALAEQAGERLSVLGYDNVRVRAGDGYFGWPEHAPFDGIMVTAAPDHVPPRLVEQLAPGGRLVMPVGESYQEPSGTPPGADPGRRVLIRITRDEGGETALERLLPVRFVPMTGRAEEGP
jgi:protein-L-isoaspartate(D-aspartate) O-methyltransferase